MVPLHMTIVWYLTRGAGIPAPSDAIDVCINKHQSALIGGDGDSQLHCRAEGPRLGHRADERKPSFLAEAFCSRREE